MKRIILTPNPNEMCGMYNVAKTLNGDIGTLYHSNSKKSLYKLFPHADLLFPNFKLQDYDEVITLLYPMHLFGRRAKKQGKKWIVYDQKVPEPRYFKSFWKRLYIKLFTKLNNQSMKGADEYWELSEKQQLPLFKGKKNYAIYLGRDEDYKNVKWLKQTMKDFGIPLVHPQNVDTDVVHALLSNAKLLVTASEWEGYGRPVMEAQALGIPVVCFDVGTHKQNVTKGFVVTNRLFNKLHDKIWEAWRIYSALQSFEESLIADKQNPQDNNNDKIVAD